MLKQLRTVIMVNVLLVVLFIASNYGIWNEFNTSNDLGYARMGPFWIQDSHSGTFINSNWVAVDGTLIMFNSPYWLFFLSTAANLFFIVRLQRSKETKQNPP